MHRLSSLLVLSAALFGLTLFSAGCGSNDSGSASPDMPREVSDAQYTTIENGLKYHDFKVGDGAEATAGDEVEVHYTGWLLSDSTKFDSSLDRGRPFTFTLGQGEVIEGWDKGVAGMRVGGERQLVIPSEYGYGQSGAGNTIPPGATLIFEVELLEVK
jgi:FKBP-type peptidyl-prolyl cis-trans isomerase